MSAAALNAARNHVSNAAGSPPDALIDWIGSIATMYVCLLALAVLVAIFGKWWKEWKEKRYGTTTIAG